MNWVKLFYSGHKKAILMFNFVIFLYNSYGYSLRGAFGFTQKNALLSHQNITFVAQKKKVKPVQFFYRNLENC